LNLFVRPANTSTDNQSICSGSTYTFGSQSLTTSGVYSGTFQDVNGCDSNVTLTLNVGSAITNTIAATICTGSTYNWGSQNLTASGSYNQTFTSATGCDSIVTLNLLVNPAITYSFADTICAATTYNWGSQSLTASGSYNQTFTSATNCDSVVTLNLFVRPVNNATQNQSICSGSTYTFGSQSLTTSGVYSGTFQDVNGCDSTVTLTLNVGSAITNTIAATICAGATYSWGSQNLTASGSYNQTFTSATGCDSIVTLNLLVNPAITYSFADTVCAATTYNWGSQSLTASGSYNQTFTSATNCDSVVTLNLFVRPANTSTDNQSICSGSTYTFGSQLLTTSGVYSGTFQDVNGCDSNVTLTLNVGSAITNTIAATICAGSTYNWGSQSLIASGSYNQTFTSATGCDSIVTLNLLINPVITYSFADTVCAATTYNWSSQSLTTSGSYNQTFTSATNCDSIVTLNLFVRPVNNATQNQSICSGSTYTFGSQSLTTSGIYSETFQDVKGCDSTVTLTLNVGSAITNTIAATICAGSTYNLGSQNLTSSGSYNQTFTSATGCDSIVTLNLLVNPVITYSFADTICAATTYNWGSQSLTASGSYNQTFVSATNCDSVVTLNLFVRPANTGTDNQSICSGSTYTFGSQSLTTSGIYSGTFQDVNGCDSTVTLTLNVTPAVTNTISTTICYGTVYNWGTQVLNASGLYTQTFIASSSCDSIVTLTLTVNPLLTDTLNETLCFGQTFTLGSQVLSTSGTYSQVFPAANGCDSLVILHLTVHPLVSDTVAASICFGGTYTLGSQNLALTGYYSETFAGANGCDSIVTVNLQVSPQPVTVTIDTAACGTVWFEGISYTSSASLIDTFFTALGCDSLYRTVNINPHPNNPIVQVVDTVSCGPLVFEGNVYTESITLSDTMFNQLGCDSIVRTINIRINNAETQTIAHEMCAGSSFTLNGQQFTTAGSYPFTFKNQAGCDSLVILELRINSLPEIEILKDNRSNYCIGDSITLQASGAQFYSWIYEDVDTLEGDYFSTILFNYKNAFSVAGVDNNGCRNTASIHIDAQACCNIWMPNAFSPNADGMNDIFKPEAQGHPKEYVMRIYNRWGETVFSTFNITQGWDGNINGKPADIADYYYRISGKCVNGEAINLKGVCTLIR
jgi:gliding motility-associated-like protein